MQKEQTLGPDIEELLSSYDEVKYEVFNAFSPSRGKKGFWASLFSFTKCPKEGDLPVKGSVTGKEFIPILEGFVEKYIVEADRWTEDMKPTRIMISLTLVKGTVTSGLPTMPMVTKPEFLTELVTWMRVCTITAPSFNPKA